MVKQKIQDFYTVAQERDFARNFLFRVVNISTGAGSNISFDEKDLVYIRTFVLPDRAIENAEVPFMGLKFNIPKSVSYPSSSDWKVKFWCDANMVVRNKLEAWTRETFDDDDSTGNYLTPKQSSVVDIVQLDPQLNAIQQIKLVGVYCRGIGAINNIDTGGDGSPLEFEATLSYHYWKRV